MIATWITRVEEAGDESGTDTGEHELERDALRRRDRRRGRRGAHDQPRRVRARANRRRGPSSNSSSTGRERARRASVPTACCASARATARSRPTSRSRAGAFPSDPVVGAARTAHPTRPPRRLQHDRARADRARVRRRTGYWRRVRERPALLVIAIACARAADVARGLLGVARSRAGERARAERVPVGHRAARRRARISACRSTSSPTSPRGSSRTTSR